MYTVDIRDRELVNIIASNYFCEPEEGEDHYDNYLRLVEAKKKVKHVLACMTDVPLWEGAEDMSCEQLIDLIEGGVNQFKTYIVKHSKPNVIQNIDWVMLREQKASLLYIISVLQCNNDNDSEHGDNLTGILHLVDAIQDHAVDINCVDKDIVFGVEEEE